MAKRASKDDKKEKRGLKACIEHFRKTEGVGLFFGRQAEMVERVPTGLLSFDDLCGWGPHTETGEIVPGIPRGRVCEVMGWEAVGKTTMALKWVKAFQDVKLRSAVFDVEYAMDWDYALKLGVDFSLDNPLDGMCMMAQPETAELALESALSLAETGEVGLVVIDSVGALCPKEELEKGLDEHTMALLARLMSKSLRKFAATCRKTNTTVLFLNQYREKIGGYSPVPGQVAKTTMGGRALRYYAALRLELARGEANVKDVEQSLEIKATLKKQKTSAKLWGRSHLRIVVGKGFDHVEDLHQVAVRTDVIAKRDGERGWWVKKAKIADKRDDVLQSLRVIAKSKPAAFEKIVALTQRALWKKYEEAGK